jgi:hypothetical protein
MHNKILTNNKQIQDIIEDSLDAMIDDLLQLLNLRHE